MPRSACRRVAHRARDRPPDRRRAHSSNRSRSRPSATLARGHGRTRRVGAGQFSQRKRTRSRTSILAMRALSVGGIDTKFFEHHRTLMTQFLDVLFDGEVDNLGLEGFLGALDDTDHWLLIAPLERGLPPSLRHRRHPRRRPQPRMAGGPRIRRQATCLLGRSRHLGFADAGHRTQVSAAIACAAHDARPLRCPCGAIGGARTESCGRNSTDCAH
jgi:hypothetical protein